MKILSIQSYFSKIAFRLTTVLTVGILCYLCVSLYLQYSERKSQLNLQATYVANAIRNDFINGNQIYLYEQCRSLAAQDNIQEIIIKKANYIFCNESKDTSRSFILSVTVPVKFQPELKGSEDTSDNIAGTVTLGIDGKEMVYYLIASLFGLIIFGAGSFFYLERSYAKMQRDIITPVKRLTDAMTLESKEILDIQPDRVRIYELQTMLKSYEVFLETTKTAEAMKIEKNKTDAVLALAKQVAHDIRSPLSVLNLLVPTLVNGENTEKCELLVQATQRIDKIAEDLLNKGRLDSAQAELNSEDVKNLVIEKQMLMASQSRNIRIDLKTQNKMFNSRISKLDFERITSNLLNNALEAFSIEQVGLVELGLYEKNNSTTLVIKDNGKGIPHDVLSQIGSKGFTLGKKNGNGLGVFHAKSTIEQAGGKFDIISQPGVGTTVTIII